MSFVIDGKRTNADVARNTGVHEMTLGRWVRDARDKGRDTSATPLTADERAELERLRAGDTLTVTRLDRLGRPVLHLVAPRAQLRELIVADTRDSLAAARARGRVGGRRPDLTPARAALRDVARLWDLPSPPTW